MELDAPSNSVSRNTEVFARFCATQNSQFGLGYTATFQTRPRINSRAFTGANVCWNFSRQRTQYLHIPERMAGWWTPRNSRDNAREVQPQWERDVRNSTIAKKKKTKKREPRSSRFLRKFQSIPTYSEIDLHRINPFTSRMLYIHIYFKISFSSIEKCSFLENYSLILVIGIIYIL